MKKKQGSILWTIAGLAIMAGVWYFKQRNNTEEVAPQPTEVALKNTGSTTPKKLAKETPKTSQPKQSRHEQAKPKNAKANKKTATTSKADSMLRVARVTDSKFTVLKGSRLVDRKYGNDGDSFLVKHNQGSTDFRLYYVDTCESWYKLQQEGAKNNSKDYRIKETTSVA